MFERVHRSPILANFEMKLNQIRIRTSHLTDFLSFRYCLPLLHQYLVVVGIGAEIGIVMFDNDQLAVATQSCAAVYNFSGGGSGNRFARFASDIDSLGCFRECLKQPAFRRPDPVERSGSEITSEGDSAGGSMVPVCFSTIGSTFANTVRGASAKPFNCATACSEYGNLKALGSVLSRSVFASTFASDGTAVPGVTRGADDGEDSGSGNSDGPACGEGGDRESCWPT